ncbi:flagellar biosynthetic protein FliO [Hydrogenophaga sp.]|uniref:FliO/MopB family protein n=1 Tax=Hydrogenophaga sp. TaxID=1904254 RepID=UPI0025C20996|nr:flagellar biosynthetic protein FliO [Hydrogenophaga sp.]
MLQNALPALILLLLMVVLAWWLQRYRRHMPGASAHGGPSLRVLNSVSLGPQQRVVTLQLSQGTQRICLVLGVAPGSVQTLHRLELPTETDSADAGALAATRAGGGFAGRLSQLMKAPHAPR